MPDAPLLGLVLQPDLPAALVDQIYDALRRRIVKGQLRYRERLPPTRRLAEELGVSRTTIVSAYDQLIAEGFAKSRPGAGVFVSNIGEVERKSGTVKPAVHEIPVASPPPRPFLHGHPDMSLFPYRRWGRCVSRVARTEPEALIINEDRFGDRKLRVEICRYLSEWRGIVASPEQVLITAGSGDALEICVRVLMAPGQHDAIALENPGYPPLASFARNIGLPIQWMHVDDMGACPPASRKTGARGTAKLAVLTPSSQFPLGGAMPQARRSAFLAWAAENSAWIIEDDYDSEFRYAGQPIPALASMDARERTLYVGSFSKIFSNGLRLGFVVVPRGLAGKFHDALYSYGAKASLTPQRPLAEFLASGEFYRHIRRVRRIYAERRGMLISLLREYLPQADFTDHRAGMQIAVYLPDEISDKTLSQRAAKTGLTCPALSRYYAKGPAQNGMLLGFCGFTPEEMGDGFKLLCACLRELE